MRTTRGHQFKTGDSGSALPIEGDAAPWPHPSRGVPGTIAFHGCKGGVGATFLAAESTAMLSTGGRRVVAIDADRDRGGLHYRLDVPVDRGSFTVDDLLPALGDLSDRALDNALSSCPCGAKLLPSAASAGAAADGSLSVAQQQDLVETLGSRFQHVVFDSAASRDGAALAGSSCVDLLVLVIVPELSSLGAAGRVLKYFDTARSGGCAVSLVVNRSLGRHDTITVSDIESYLTLPVAIVLPEETALCRGLPETGSFAFAQRSPLGRGLRAMARRLFDCATAPTS